MFAVARRPEPQRRPIGTPGISEAAYERIAARLRAERADLPASRIRGAVNRLGFQPVIITEGTRP